MDDDNPQELLLESLLAPQERQQDDRQTIALDREGEKNEGVVILPVEPQLQNRDERFLDEYTQEEDELLSTTTNSIWTVYYEILLFFACGVGSSLCYIATLSALVYFMVHYGPNLYVYLNLAMYVPLLPISLIQARYDQEYDKLYQSYNTFFFRGMVGFALSILGTVLIATMTNTSTSGRAITRLLIAAVLQGMGGSILLGSLNQMVSFVMETTLLSSTPQFTSSANAATSNEGSGSRRLKAALSAGVQASALVVLLVSIITGFVGQGEEEQQHDSESENPRHKFSLDPFGRFFYTIVVLECVLCGVFVVLMYFHPPVATSMKRRDQSILISVSEDGSNRYTNTVNDSDLLDPPSSRNVATVLMTQEENRGLYNIFAGTVEEGREVEEEITRLNASSPLLLAGRPQLPSPPHSDWTFGELWDSTKSCCITLVITLVPSFLVGTWFTHVQTQWVALPQILFYVRIGSDLVGRIATVWIPPRSISCLTYTALLRYIPVAIFFINASSPLVPWSHLDVDGNGNDTTNGAIRSASDYISIGLVAFIAFFSGYLVTGCFQLAPGLLAISPPLSPLSMSVSFSDREVENEEEGDQVVSPISLNGRNDNANVAKQASLLNVAFSVAALGGLVSSFVLIGLGL